MKVILASASPRRHELLKMICKEFTIKASNFDERSIEFNGNVEEYVKKLSFEKAKEISKLNPRDLIIGVDTVVFLDGKLLNKPVSEDDARSMIKLMSGKTHSVYTGYALINEEKNILKQGFEITKVSFTNISDNELENYLKTQDYIGKAGAYAIQGEAAKFIEKIYGDFFNVVGLPLSKLYKELKILNSI